MKRTCPKCKSKAVRLYRSVTKDGKRTWEPVAWHCTTCGYTYYVAKETLIYDAGGKQYEPSTESHCTYCKDKLVRLYRHKNPVHGKQQWKSVGWYCKRCKYTWMDEKVESVTA
jgi:transposase-like protein